MSEEKSEVDHQAEPLIDFANDAKTAKNFLKDKNLNPPTMKQRLARWGAAIGLGAAGVTTVGFMANEAVEANSNADWFGKPISGEVIHVQLQKVNDNHNRPIGPTFRDDAKVQDNNELTPEEIAERGIGLNPLDVMIREVKGATYPSGIAKGFDTDEKGNNYGMWGEIVVEDPNTKEIKGTGIFMSGNQYSKPQPTDR
jgi:hypothetical protein